VARLGRARVKEDNLNLNSAAWTHVVSRLRVRNINFTYNDTTFPTHSWLRAMYLLQSGLNRTSLNGEIDTASFFKNKWTLKIFRLVHFLLSIFGCPGYNCNVTRDIKNSEKSSNGEPLKSLRSRSTKPS